MFVSNKALNSRHLTVAFCIRGAERKRCCLLDEEAQAVVEEAFKSYGIPLVPVNSFRYLGIFFSVDDDDWLVAVRNLCKAQRKWALLVRVLSREGGGGVPDLRTDILGGGTVSPDVRFIEICDYATHWEGVGRILPQVGLQAYR